MGASEAFIADELGVFGEDGATLASRLNPFITGPNNERSTLNRTSTSPGAASTYTGGWDFTAAHGSLIAVVVSTSQLSRAFIEWSDDGVTAEADSGVFDLVEDTTIPGLFVYFHVVQETRFGKYARLNVTTIDDPALFTTDLYLNKNQFNGFYVDADDPPGRNALYKLTRAITVGRRPDNSLQNSRQPGIAESTTALLSTGGGFDSGIWHDSEGYNTILVAINSDAPSAVDGIRVQFSDDPTGATIRGEAVRTYDATMVGQGVQFPFKKIARYVHYDYTNNSTGQNEFFYEMSFSPEDLAPQSPYNSPIQRTNTAVMTRSSVTLLNAGADLIDLHATPGPGLPAGIVDHAVATPIKPLGTAKTGRAQVSSNFISPLPPMPLTDRAVVEFTNHSTDVTIWFSEDEDKLTSQADGILPLSYRSFELDAGEQFYFQTEGGAGATTNTLSLNPNNVVSNSGVTDPANTFASDNARAIFDAINDTCKVNGFDATTAQTLTDIDSVILKAELRRQPSPPASTVAFVDKVDKTQTGGTSVTTGTVLGGTDQCYVAIVASGEKDPQFVSSMAGLGLTWTKYQEGISSNTKNGISLWVATGSPSSGTVTANFAGPVEATAMTVLRYSGVDQAAPVEASNQNEGAGGGENSFTVPAIAGTLTTGRFIGGINSNIRTPTFSLPTTPRSDLTTGKVHLVVQDGAATTSNTMAGTHGGDAPDWYAVALTLKPATPGNPEVRLSYEVLGVPGASTVTQSISSTTDTTISLDVTGDRAWTYANVDDLRIVPTLTNHLGADLEIDHLWVQVGETSNAALAVISWTEGGGIL